jgi:hypothetical protein
MYEERGYKHVSWVGFPRYTVFTRPYMRDNLVSRKSRLVMVLRDSNLAGTDFLESIGTTILPIMIINKEPCMYLYLDCRFTHSTLLCSSTSYLRRC